MVRYGYKRRNDNAEVNTDLDTSIHTVTTQMLILLYVEDEANAKLRTYINIYIYTI